MTRVLVVTGATGTGKTGACVEVAEHLGGEIISADSRQIYRGLVIGTAAPSPERQARVPHYLVNERDPRLPWSAGAFAARAAECIRDIAGRNKVPLVVGGSGLYLRALTEGLFEEPPVPDTERRRVRERLRRRARREGIGALYAELQRCDPEMARVLPSTDTQRILRGLEVFALHGTPLSDLQRVQASGPPLEADWCLVLLEREREDLYTRLDARVERLVERGWLTEARQLMSAGLTPEAPGLTGLGYEVLFRHLQGHLCLEEAIKEIQQQHRRYAKSQITWYRQLSGATRLSLSAGDGARQTADKILACW